MKHKIQVVTLPTEDKDYPLYTHDKGYLIEGKYRVGKPNGTQCHLYITVSQEVEPIKEGDWYIDMFVTESQRSVQTHTETRHLINHKKDYRFKFCRKIIATTNPKLRMPISKSHSCQVPQVQQSFLKEFVVNPDGEWEVEYEESYVDGFTEDRVRRFYGNDKLKLNQDNEVTITSVVEEKMYSREEMIAYGNKTFRRGINEGYLAFPVLHTKPLDDNWIKENL